MISGVLGDGVTLIDSGEAAAAEVGEILDARELRNPSGAKPNIQFFVSDIPRSSPRWANASSVTNSAGYAAPRDFNRAARPTRAPRREKGERRRWNY